MASIAAAGSLLPDSAATPEQNVALLSVKRRRQRSVPIRPPYPASQISDHVPFYLAAKSPMLYSVAQGHEDYQGGSDDLVFLGARLGDVTSSGLTWCATNGNAAAPLSEFSTNLQALGDFVDFDLLMAKWWNNTLEDPDRRRRRAAEVLVHPKVPLSLISLIVTKSDRVQRLAYSAWQTVGGARQYVSLPAIYY